MKCEFSILRDLLRNLIFWQNKLCCFFLSQQVTYFKNWLSMIEALPIDFHLSFLNIWCKNSYELNISWSSVLDTLIAGSLNFLKIRWKSISKLLKLLERFEVGKKIHQIQNAFGFTKEWFLGQKRTLQIFLLPQG